MKKTILLSLLGVSLTLADDIQVKAPMENIVTGAPEADITPLLGANEGEIISVREEAERLREASQKPLKTYIVKNGELKHKQGKILDLELLVGVPLTVEFFDNLKNKVGFKYFSPSNDFFTIVKDTADSHRIFITPTQKFRTGVVTIGVEGFDDPVVLRLYENSSKETYSTYTKVVMSGFSDKGSDGTTTTLDNYKKRILQQTVDLNNFEFLEDVGFEIWTLNEKKLAILGDDTMAIKYVKNNRVGNKGFYVVLLHQFFDIEGYDKLLFPSYKDKYRAYMLDFNTNVFTIKNRESGDRYRVVVQ